MDLQIIQNKIFEVRGCRVMLDYHLAELYQVETRALKQAVKRNIERFHAGFCPHAPNGNRLRGTVKAHRGIGGKHRCTI